MSASGRTEVIIIKMHQVKWKGVVGIPRSDSSTLASAAHLTELPASKFWSCSHRYSYTSSPHAQTGFITHPPPLPGSPSLLTSAQIGSCPPVERPYWGGWSAAEPAGQFPPLLSPQSLQGLGWAGEPIHPPTQNQQKNQSSRASHAWGQSWEASNQQAPLSSPEAPASSKGLQKPLHVAGR